MKLRRSIICLLLLILLPSCASMAKDEEQVSDKEKTVIRFSHVVGEDTPKGQAARLFAKLIKERSNGKVEIQVFSNGSLFKDSEELTALSKGYVQMIAPAFSKMNGTIPELGVFDLPYLFSDIYGYHHVFDGKIGKIIAQKLDEKNMVLLGIWDSGLKQFTNNLHPIRLPQDMSGLTMRIMPSSVLDEQFKMLGVHPVEMNFNDVYLSLEQGRIQGQENTLSNIYTKRFYRVQKYLTLSNHGYLGYLVVMEKTFWNKLTPDIQKVILDTMKEVTTWERQQSIKIDQDKLKEISSCNCIQIDRLSESEIATWKEFYQPLYQNMEHRLSDEFLNELGQSR